VGATTRVCGEARGARAAKEARMKAVSSDVTISSEAVVGAHLHCRWCGSCSLVCHIRTRHLATASFECCLQQRRVQRQEQKL
jgi:hypothetical protein